MLSMLICDISLYVFAEKGHTIRIKSIQNLFVICSVMNVDQYSDDLITFLLKKMLLFSFG